MLNNIMIIDIFKDGLLTFDTSALSNMFNEEPQIQEQIRKLISEISEVSIIIPSQVAKEFNEFDHSSKNVNLDATIKSFLFENITKEWDKNTEEMYTLIGESRFANKFPPGYKDSGKKASPLKKFGDYFVWQQLIDYAKDHYSDMLFIINDRKSDWYDKNNLDYRHELYEEFFLETKHKVFFISLKDFYRSCEEIFGIKLGELIIDIENKENISAIIQKHFWANEYEIATEYIENVRNQIEIQVEFTYDYIGDIEIVDLIINEDSVNRRICDGCMSYEGACSCEVNLELMAHANGEDFLLGSAVAVIDIGFTCMQELEHDNSDILELELTTIKNITVFECEHDDPDYDEPDYDEPDYDESDYDEPNDD